MQESKSARERYLERVSHPLLQERYDRVTAMREAGEEPFATDFPVRDTAAGLYADYGGETDEERLASAEVVVAGRLRLMRRMGKAMFLKLQDRTCFPGFKGEHTPEGQEDDGLLQVFVSQKEVGPEAFARLQNLDLGDILGVKGALMRTRTGELTVNAQDVRLLTKAIRPLPQKFRAMTDVEQRFRMRYVDLTMNPDVRRIFQMRSRIVSMIRAWLDARAFMEVETPMLHAIHGGAAARPFATHHNALDMELFLRIAPELYLKRLLVGGLERVYEINRNFRNEGLSRRHNPEFTMLELYQAYATWEDLMELTEELICHLAESLHGRDEQGRLVLHVEGHEVDLARPWRRVSIADAVAEHLSVDAETVGSRAWLAERCKALMSPSQLEASDVGQLQMALFEEHVESTLIQPTFVIDFPASVSPLARRKASNPDLVDRFELFVLGRELANAFNELNDPEDQYLRFCDQLEARESGDEEAMPMDEDYIRALEFGMPPAAGEGIGIDRLTMLLTGADSIREVILFPQLRPEAPA